MQLCWFSCSGPVHLELCDCASVPGPAQLELVHSDQLIHQSSSADLSGSAGPCSSSDRSSLVQFCGSSSHGSGSTGVCLVPQVRVQFCTSGSGTGCTWAHATGPACGTFGLKTGANPFGFIRASSEPVKISTTSKKMPEMFLVSSAAQLVHLWGKLFFGCSLLTFSTPSDNSPGWIEFAQVLVNLIHLFTSTNTYKKWMHMSGDTSSKNLKCFFLTGLNHQNIFVRELHMYTLFTITQVKETCACSGCTSEKFQTFPYQASNA